MIRSEFGPVTLLLRSFSSLQMALKQMCLSLLDLTQTPIRKYHFTPRERMMHTFRAKQSLYLLDKFTYGLAQELPFTQVITS